MKRQLVVRFGMAIVLGASSLLATATTASAAGAPPANDNIAGATLISTASTAGSNIDSTNEGSGGSAEYQSGDAQFNSTVWYYWVPTTSESATISSCNSAATTRLNVYTETEVGYPSSLAVKSNAPSVVSTSCTRGDTVTFSAVATKRYYVQVLTTNGGEGSFTITVSTASAPAAAPVVPLSRVTICHRTHATTNPYRIITVSTSSIVNSSSVGVGHGLHNSKKTRSNDGIFKGATEYPKANQKYWGDIIPPFTSTNGGTFAGLNWKWGSIADSALADGTLTKDEFKAINADTAATGGTQAFEIAALKLCQGTASELTAKQAFDLDRKNGPTRKEILDELKELDDLETDPANKEGTDLEKQLPAKEGPKKEPTNVPDQSLAGVVWLDLNRNGFQEENEPNMPNISVTIAQTDPATASGFLPKFGGTSIGKGVALAVRWLEAQSPFVNGFLGNLSNALSAATTYKVTTDANGAYLFKSIGAGDWTVVGVVPAGLEVTYDSAGVSDASVDATVPVSGFAFTWVGLVGNSGIKAPLKNPDGSAVTNEVVISSAGADGKFCTADDVNYILTPVDGVITLEGVATGEYRVESIGGKKTLGTFTVGDSTYTSTITTKFGTKCPKAKSGDQLADTGVSDDLVSYGLLGLAMLLIGAGGFGFYRSRKLT